MILVIIFIIISIVGATIFFMIKKGKKICSCIGKKCGSSDGCGNICCDVTKNQKCINNTCCSADCSGKTCSQKNDCGESCISDVCGVGQKCVDGNCYTPECNNLNECQDDGYGGICPCSVGTCYKGQCCVPHDCSKGRCTIDGSCGQPPCTCNDAYCFPQKCCLNGTCNYEDICNSPSVSNYLKNTWGRFCPQCVGCDLIDAEFEGNAIAPIKGFIQCKRCKVDDTSWKQHPPAVAIDKNVGYYYNLGGNIVPGSSADYCKTIGCDQCVCVSDDDCTRFGCTSCVGFKCT
jgi:hypothetical protein